jgi:hypothetical protein
MDPITLDTNLAKKLDMGMRAGDAVELPFPVIYIWALNGQASYKSQGGALYYGGWACKAEDLQAITDQQGLPVPADWKQVTIASRDGGEFEAVTSRNVIVAPIGKRESWLFDGKRFSDYVEGGRRHLQVLAYLAEARGENGTKQFLPWGPVVLTAKGYQARNLLDAFARWDKATSQIRWKMAPGVPAWCFFLSLGTFGRERLSVNVGKPGAQSPITPISVYVPDRITEDFVANLFVGSQVAEQMSALQDQAADWLKAWKEETPVELVEEFVENGAPVEEEIPF